MWGVSKFGGLIYVFRFIPDLLKGMLLGNLHSV